MCCPRRFFFGKIFCQESEAEDDCESQTNRRAAAWREALDDTRSFRQPATTSLKRGAKT
jgi:hypothetical protein